MALSFGLDHYEAVEVLIVSCKEFLGFSGVLV